MVALTAIVHGRTMPVQATEQCPGDRVVWVSQQHIFEPDEHAAQIPGQYDCETHALQTGATKSTRHKKVTQQSHADGASPADAVPPPAPPPEPPPGSEAHASVLDSVYADVDRGSHRERAGYGRYTYVLLTSAHDAERNIALLHAVMDTTPIASSVSIDRRQLNVFEIPETIAFWRDPSARTDSQKTLVAYDFGAAHDLVVKACEAPQRPALCAGDLSGPFLLTYAHPLEALKVANPPYLIVDLHRLNARGFEHLVALMKEQVKESDVADGHLVEGTSVHLLSTVLDISDWLPNLVSDVKNITSVVGAH